MSNTEELREQIGELEIDGIQLQKFDAGYMVITNIVNLIQHHTSTLKAEYEEKVREARINAFESILSARSTDIEGDEYEDGRIINKGYITIDTDEFYRIKAEGSTNDHVVITLDEWERYIAPHLINDLAQPPKEDE